MKLLSLFLVFAINSYAVASGHGEAEGPVSPFTLDFLFRIINFLILFGGLAYFLAKPLKGFLKSRKESVEKAIMESRVAKQEAEKKAAYYEEKLSKLEAEVNAMIETFKRESEEEKVRLIKEAEDQIEKMRERMQKSLEQERIRLKSEIMETAVDLSVKMAGDIIKKNLSAEDQKKMLGEYIKMMENLN